MKFITNFLKKRRKVMLLKKISTLKVQSSKYLELAKLQKENSQSFQTLINIYTEKAKFGDSYCLSYLTMKLSDWTKISSDYMISSAAAFTTAQNIQNKISMLEKELKEL